MAPDDKKQRKELMRSLAFFSQVAISMAACVLGGVLLGRYLDGLLGTSPWLLLIFSFLGMAAAFKSMYDLSK